MKKRKPDQPPAPSEAELRQAREALLGSEGVSLSDDVDAKQLIAFHQPSQEN